MQEFEVALQHVFYSQENIAKPCAVHKRSQSLSMICYWRGHSLNEVVQGIEPGVDDGMAKPFKSADIQRNVIVYEEDRSGTMHLASRNAVKRISVKITTAHFDDGAEATVMGAAARSLDDICLAAKDRVALQHPRAAVGKANLVIFQSARRTLLVVNPLIAATVREPGDEVHVATAVERTRQLPECNFTLPRTMKSTGMERYASKARLGS
jgi:hypothetical protein